MGVAAVAALSACATGADNDVTMPVFSGSSSGSGSGSSSGSSGSTPDATTSGDDSSGGNYGDDTSNPNPGDDSPVSTGDDSGDDGGSTTPPGPTCTPGQACVDGIPGGWSGFVQLMIGAAPTSDAGAGGAGCAAPYDTVQPALGGQTNPDGGPAACGSCNCFVPDAGVTCSIGIGINNLGCLPKTGGPTSAAAQDTCVSGLSLPSGEVTTPTLTAGQCEGTTPVVTTPPPTATAATATACGTSDDGGAAAAGDAGAAVGTTCVSGQACAPLPGTADAGTPSGVCIYQAGVQTCPPAGTTLFTNTFVVGAVEDSRGCTCTCGTLTCPSDGYVAGYGNNNCSGAPTLTIDAGTACKGSLSQTSFKYIPSKSGSPGACGAATSAPSGDVDIDGGSATTFCCIP